MPDDGPQGSGYRLYTRWHVVAAALGGLAVLGGTFAIVGVERYERAVATVQLARMGGRRLVLDADVDRRVMPSEEAALVERSATVLRRRIEKLTGKRVLSTVEGRKVILDLPLPTVEQWGRLEAARHGEKLLPLLLQQAKLEFKPVDDEQKPLAAIRELPAYISLDWDRYEGPGGRIVSSAFLRSDDQAGLVSFLSGKSPPGREFAIQKRAGPAGKTWFRSYLLENDAGLTGDHITDALVAFDGKGSQSRPYVQVTFTRAGANLFATLTRANVKKRMAIALDGQVQAAPVIESEIPGGICSIHLGGIRPINEMLQEAKDLALVLKSGFLPLRLRVASVEPIDPR